MPELEQQWVSVARLADVPPGTVKGVQVAEHSLALINVDGSVYAVNGICPHRGGPLASGRLIKGELSCPWHGFRYDPRTGRATMPAQHPGVETFSVRIVGDAIQVALASDSGKHR